MTVTCVPSRRQTEPSSMPTTPAPMTTKDFGISGNDNAPSESTMRSWSTGTPGRGVGSDPVAITMLRALTSIISPALSVTVRRPGAVMRAHPWSRVTLFLRMR